MNRKVVTIKKVPAHKEKFSSYFRANWILYVMSIPGLLYVIIYKFVPYIGLSLAFKDFNMFAGSNLFDSLIKSPWVGFKYFRQLFEGSTFWTLLGNTLSISLYKLIFLFPLPIIIALLINEIRNTSFKKTVQTIIYLPHFLSWVVISGVFFTLLSSTGVVNSMLSSLGLGNINFLTNPDTFRSLLVFTEGWKETGWSCVVYISALTAIDPCLYEAAEIDGANRLQRMCHVSLPGMIPIIMMMLMMRIGNILQAGTDQILVMYNPAVYSTGDVLQTYIYRVGLGQMDFSTATALGLFESVVGFILIVAANSFSRHFFNRSLW